MAALSRIVDWQMVCLRLRNHLPLERIAKEVEADAGTIRRLARGDTVEPKFATGIALLDMYNDLDGEWEQVRR